VHTCPGQQSPVPTSDLGSGHPRRRHRSFPPAGLRTSTSHGSFHTPALSTPTGEALNRSARTGARIRTLKEGTQTACVALGAALLCPSSETCARETFTVTGGQPGLGAALANTTTEDVVRWVGDPRSKGPRSFRAVAGLSTSATVSSRAPARRARESPSPTGRRSATGRTTERDPPRKLDDPIGMRNSAERHRAGDRGTTGRACSCLVAAARSPPCLRT